MLALRAKWDVMDAFVHPAATPQRACATRARATATRGSEASCVEDKTRASVQSPPPEPGRHAVVRRSTPRHDPEPGLGNTRPPFREDAVPQEDGGHLPLFPLNGRALDTVPLYGTQGAGNSCGDPFDSGSKASITSVGRGQSARNPTRARSTESSIVVLARGENPSGRLRTTPTPRPPNARLPAASRPYFPLHLPDGATSAPPSRTTAAAPLHAPAGSFARARSPVMTGRATQRSSGVSIYRRGKLGRIREGERQGPTLHTVASDDTSAKFARK